MLGLANDAIQADAAVHLYESCIFHDRVKIALQQGINLCEAIEEYNDEPEQYQEIHDYFSIIGIIITYDGSSFH